MTMEVIISDEKAKELLKQVLVEMITREQDLFHRILLDALEEKSLANAISRGRKDDFASEERILELLEA